MVVAESHLQHETTVLFRYDNNSIVEYETYIEIWLKPPASWWNNSDSWFMYVYVKPYEISIPWDV